MAQTIAVLSQKGGTGKTTAVRTLTDVLRRCGVRTLAVDLDPQGNLSDYFDLPTDVQPTIAEVLAGSAKASEAIHEDIIPANLSLAEAELMLGGKMGRELTLKRALADRALQPGMVHHSDRGVQYASGDYVALLESHGFLVSMSRTGNPYDNAKAESFMKTLKCEEVYLNTYRNRDEALASIAHFIDEVYNSKRLHSALGYLAPDTFEANTKEEPNTNEKVAASRQLVI